MSLNSIIMLVRVFSDIMILHVCLNDTIMSCEHWGARWRPKCALDIFTTPQSVQVRETRVFIDFVRVRRLFVANSRHLTLARIKTPKK